MRTQDGKFVLFLDILELAAWLDASSFSRVVRLLQCHHTFIPRYATSRERIISSCSTRWKQPICREGSLRLLKT
jgi:hypothetical protein